MKQENHLTVSGIVVTVAFGVGLGATIIVVAVMQLRSRNNTRRESSAPLLMVGGDNWKGVGGSDIEATQALGRRGFGMASEANLPLITPGGTRSDQQYHNKTEADYSAQAPSASGSNTERGVVPKLLQGLGALG